jgi:FMN phosphatase YigB (HAD superfamily)
MPTLLLDLDDTLLQNPVDQFIPTYLKLFASFVSDRIDPKAFSHSLLFATDQMIANQDFSRTLQSTFEEYFYPSFEPQKDELAKTMDDFYSSKYPTLRSFTHPRPEAVALIKDAISSRSNIVVATNPLFPLSVQLQRLSWADLSLDQYPEISFVTSYEYLHFAKPNPVYYAEILALLGWPEDPITMIGDSYSEDILPSSILGISSFHIQNQENSPQDHISTVPAGTLIEAHQWLKNVNSKLEFESKASILAALKGSAAALDTILKRSTQSTSFDCQMIENVVLKITHFDRETLPELIQADSDPILLLQVEKFFLFRKKMITEIEQLSESEFLKSQPLFSKIVAHDQFMIRQLFSDLSGFSPNLIKSIMQ